MLTDMTLTPEESKEENGLPYAGSDAEGPKYPYGLTLYLCDDVVKKLGLPAMAIGAQVRITGDAYVSSMSADRTQDGGTSSTVSLQITAMEVQGQSNSDGAASKLWPGN